MAVQDIIYEIKIKTGVAVTSITALENEIKKLRSEVKNGLVPADKIEGTQQKIAAGTALIKDFNAELKKVKAGANTIQGLRDNVSELNKQWRNTEIGTNEFKRLEKELGNANSQLVKAEANAGVFGRNVGNYTGAIKGQFINIGAAIAGAFTVSKITDFIKESVNLSLETEEVAKAFERIDKVGLLDNLRTATDGTLNNLKLMKLALRAENIGIPLNDFSKILELANRKSEELGLNVEEVSEKILNGIGSKSVKAFRDIGITAFDVSDKFSDISLAAGTVGDVSKIMADVATTELARIGAGIDSNVDKIDKLSATWDNLKTAIGGWIVNSSLGQAALDKLNDIAQHQNQLADARAKGLTEFDFQSLKFYIADKQRELDKQELNKKSLNEVIDSYSKQIQLSKELSREKQAQQKIVNELETKRLQGKGGAEFKMQDLDNAKENLALINEKIKAEQDFGNQIGAIYNSKILPVKKEETKLTKEQIAAQKQATKDQSDADKQAAQDYADYIKAKTKEIEDFYNETQKTQQETASINEQVQINLIKDATEQKLAQEEKRYKDALQAFNDSNTDNTISNADHNARIEALEREHQQKMEEIKNPEKKAVELNEYGRTPAEQKAFDAKQQAELAAISAIQQAENAAFNLSKQQSDAKTKHEIDALDKQLKNKTISQATYDKKKEAIDKANFEKGKKRAIAQATINGILAELSTLAASPGGLDIATLGAARIIEMAAVAVVTGIEIAGIAAEKFALGGQINGASHSQGGVPIIAEGGEGILRKSAMESNNSFTISGTPKQITSGLNQRFGGRSFFENGGSIPANISVNSNNNMSSIVDAISNIQLNAQISIREINKVNNRISSIETNSKL